MNRVATSRHFFASVIWAFVALSVLTVNRAYAADISDNCDTSMVTDSYHHANGDVSTERSLEITRPNNGKGRLNVTVCTGNLRILPALDGQLHLKIDVEGRPIGSMDRFVRKVEVQNDNADISLAFPKDLHPTITLRIPMDTETRSEIEVGGGQLNLRGDALHGDRELTVGSGHIKIFLRADTEYSQLVANVGMGNLHDRRPGRRSIHLSASRTEQGSGSGRIIAFVGFGSIELNPEE